MKPEPTLVFDDRDREMVAILTDLGLGTNVAKVLVYLAQVEEAISRDVEQGADMRQPEVSNAMRTLRRRGWVHKRDIQSDGKGRPRHGYRLALPFDGILDHLEERKRREIERDLEKLDRVRSLGNGF